MERKKPERDGWALNMIGYSCMACGAEQDAGFGGYMCPACGGNLDITYDYPAVARAVGGRFPDGDDLFRYAALLPLGRPERSIPLRIGQTPLYPAPRLGQPVGLSQVHLKDDSVGPSASFKDRASLVTACRALELKAPVVATASTGNAGASLACVSAALGLRCVIFVPASAPPAKMTQLRVYGAEVLAVQGSYDDAFDLCREACETFGWLNRSTGLNPYTREGKKTCSYEIWEGLGHQAPDWIAVPVGDGNILSGIWKGWRDLKALGWTDRLPRMLCVQSQGSAAITRAIRSLPVAPDWSQVAIAPVEASTRADSLSVDLPRDGLAGVRAVFESDGAAVAVSDADILAAIPEVARATGIFAEPAAAAAWAGVRQLARARHFGPDERIVCLITGSGLKDVAGARHLAGEPRRIEPCLQTVRRVLGANGVSPRI